MMTTNQLQREESQLDKPMGLDTSGEHRDHGVIDDWMKHLGFQTRASQRSSGTGKQ